MATGGNTDLNDDLTERLAGAIEVTKMETIAISYLKIKSETVSYLRVAHQGNPTAFNRSLLNLWKYMNPGTDQVQVSSASNDQFEGLRKFTSLQRNKKILGEVSPTFFNVFESSVK